jgi:ComF family protein
MKALKHKEPLFALYNGLLDMAFPELCLLCNRPLNLEETGICHDCLYHLPKTHITSYTENKSAELFYGKLPFVKAVSGFNYMKESSLQTTIEFLKYKGKKELGKVLGSMVGLSLQQGGFFNDIDLLVPVPLHPKRFKKRGYNQTEWIAKGVSDVSGLPIDTKTLLRVTDNSTQTRKHVFERWENVSSIFTLKTHETFKNKHILLIDDVLTSGSTLEACGRTVLSAAGCRVSFLTLAKA